MCAIVSTKVGGEGKRGVCACIVALWHGCGSFGLFFIAALAIFVPALALPQCVL